MIQPGLERIGLLLKNVKLPWKAIHVAGTNGKGSICAYASNLLTLRTVRVGRFTSPHLLDRWDCIAINEEPIKESTFKEVEKRFLQLNEEQNIKASEFEILTATAFQLFNDLGVDIGVVEVGMGGKLDATNILNNQAVSVISKISYDHQNFLGNTLEEIVTHKAGILRPGVPYVVNPRNEWHIQIYIDDIAKEVGAGPRIDLDSEDLRVNLYRTKIWNKNTHKLVGFQKDNAVLAYVAVVEALKAIGQPSSKAWELVPGLKKKFPGRMQIVKPALIFGSYREVLVDGAHNEDAAMILAQYVNQKLRPGNRKPHSRPVTWLLAMSDGRDARKFLSHLLRSRDNVVTVEFGPVDGMPWVKPMDSKDLLRTVHDIHPDMTGFCNGSDVLRALFTAKHLAELTDSQVVVTGSLYLIADVLRIHKHQNGFTKLNEINAQERHRVHNAYSAGGLQRKPRSPQKKEKTSEESERELLQQEIEKLERELKDVEKEEGSIP
ncbi:FolC bifunctional protein [Zopfia rhizophila CBS 207.26]|uniref:FolC bifunctional protein n=1 Tax=Zopfia rhizophila CBS 207.26 TaxID=1314779 RepID=A0A6A6E1K3_9PEZI|nr:FolC bifunctional protein [Zopfia rhizophila CBS 207.26]